MELHRSFVLHSGGVDSSTALAMAHDEAQKKGQWHDVVSVSVDYGQRHKKETTFAKMLCDYLNVSHMIVSMAHPPKSMLTNPEMKLPNSTYAELPEGISPTYVPFRNGQLLSRIAGIAQGWIMEQDTLGLTATASIWFGAHADDAARDAYPDCTPEFIGNMASAIYLGTYRRVRLITPFTHMEKKSIVDIGASLALPYMLTWSCYDGGPKHCGVCPTCRARKEAFTLAHVPDPTQYENTSIVKSGLSGTYSPPNPNMIDLKGGVLLSPPPMEEPPPPMAEPSAPFMAEPSAPFMEEPKAFVQRNLPLDLNGDDIPF